MSALFLINFLSDELPWAPYHTCSLSYEEQFYLIFPLLLILLRLTVQPRILLLVLLVIALAYTVLKMLELSLWANYLSHINFLLTGCTSAIYWRRLSPICRSLNVTSWLMIVTLLIACVGLLSNSVEVYFRILLYPPKIGLLVIATSINNSKVRAFFHNPKLTYLGKISYTVYLWQQLATAPYPTLSPWLTLLFVLLTWIFAIFLYEYFESPLINLASK